jgi:hypothetical protein
MNPRHYQQQRFAFSAQNDCLQVILRYGTPERVNTIHRNKLPEPGSALRIRIGIAIREIHLFSCFSIPHQPNTHTYTKNAVNTSSDPPHPPSHSQNTLYSRHPCPTRPPPPPASSSNTHISSCPSQTDYRFS